MKLNEVRKRLLEIDPLLGSGQPVEFQCFERDGHKLRVFLTQRLKMRAEKQRLWGTKAMMTTLKNASYGFDSMRPRSRGGADGIFLLDRDHRPINPMMRKIFDSFLDRPDSGAEQVAAHLSVRLADMLPVRLVSHDLRLLGLLSRREEDDRLVIIDCDASG